MLIAINRTLITGESLSKIISKVTSGKKEGRGGIEAFESNKHPIIKTI